MEVLDIQLEGRRNRGGTFTESHIHGKPRRDLVLITCFDSSLSVFACYTLVQSSVPPLSSTLPPSFSVLTKISIF